MGKKGKKMQAGKPKKLTPKGIGKRLDALVKKLEEELKGTDLFAPPPPTEDCPVCFVPFSRIHSEADLFSYMFCCGKEICWACYKENEASINRQNKKSSGKTNKRPIVFTCPFCREPDPNPGLEYFRQLQARCLQNDHKAFTLMGAVYENGECEIAKDDLKSLDFYIRGVELGSADACFDIWHRYATGNGVAVDEGRAALFNRIGALRGDIGARHIIGYTEYYDLGNHEFGIRHWKVAAEVGYQKSLNMLRDIYNANGKLPGKEFITKEYLVSAYRACHEAQMEVKTEEREKYRDEE